jgi:hypothetical protein
MAKALRVSASKAMGMAATPVGFNQERSVWVWRGLKKTAISI